MNRHHTLSVLGSLVLLLSLTFGNTFAQSSLQTINRLNQYEDKVDLLQNRVAEAEAIYNAIMGQLAVNPSSCVNSQFCALQSKVAQFNGPLNVMRVKSDQLRDAGLLMGTGAVSTVRYQIEQSLDGNSNAASSNSLSINSVSTIGDDLAEMNRLIDGCIRREIQEIRQNL